MYRRYSPWSYLIALYITAWVLFLRSFYGKAFGDASVLVNKQDKPHAFLFVNPMLTSGAYRRIRRHAMAEQKNLTAIFESNKPVLKEKLEGLSLPSDASKIQKIINDYLNEMFNNEGEFRQNLTQAEDYILQAALSLLNAQQVMIKEVTPTAMPKLSKSQPTSPQPFSRLKKEKYPLTLGGTAIGGGVGGLLLGTWGAVFGAIAGTAIILYYASNQTAQTSRRKDPEEKSMLQPSKLNVDVFLAIVKNICGSVDSLIDTFRAQINRVVNKYESQEKPTLEKEYRFLLESVQSLIGCKRAHNEDEKFVRKIQERIEDMAESLDNYNLVVEDYTDEHRNWFDTIENQNVQSVTQALPAIVKNGNVVLKGRVFIPEVK